jgi:hypothetical protein
MRRSFLAACTLPLVLVLTIGCGGREGGKAGVSATSTLSPQDQALKYTQCMRDHGVPMDDPQVQGNRIQLGDIKETDPTKVQAAEQACQQYKPGGGGNGGNPPAEKIELLRQLAKCMRAHGVENFPDPDASGKLPIDDSVTKDPQFEPAQRACQQQDNGGQRSGS